MNNHTHCQSCGKMIYENKKPQAHTNSSLVRYTVLCGACVDILGGDGSDMS